MTPVNRRTFLLAVAAVPFAAVSVQAVTLPTVTSMSALRQSMPARPKLTNDTLASPITHINRLQREYNALRSREVDVMWQSIGGR